MLTKKYVMWCKSFSFASSCKLAERGHRRHEKMFSGHTHFPQLIQLEVLCVFTEDLVIGAGVSQKEETEAFFAESQSTSTDKKCSFF